MAMLNNQRVTMAFSRSFVCYFRILGQMARLTAARQQAGDCVPSDGNAGPLRALAAVKRCRWGRMVM